MIQIGIKLNKKDIGKEIILDKNHKILPDISFNYMDIYIKDYDNPYEIINYIFDNLTDYYSVYSYILGGNKNTVNSKFDLSKWNNNKPTFVNNLNGPIDADYYFLFENNRWVYKTYNEYENWKSIDEFKIEK